jgi:hypothetical protein
VSLPVVVPPRVDLAILEIDLWWRSNREKAPDLFEEELAGAIDLISGSPRVGMLQSHATLANLRRVLLRSTRFHVYDVASDTEITVVAVWSSFRGHGPDLSRY